MSDAVLISLIGSITSIVLSSIAAVFGFLNNKMGRQNSVALALTKDNIATLEKNTNSIKDALVEVNWQGCARRGLRRRCCRRARPAGLGWGKITPMQAGVYRHYKGGYYQVLGIAEHSETKERMVVYVSLTGAHLPGPRMRVRPYAEFIQEDVEIEDPADSCLTVWVKRYEYIGDEIPADADVPLSGRLQS